MYLYNTLLILYNINTSYQRFEYTCVCNRIHIQDMDICTLDKDNKGLSSYLILKESFTVEMEFRELFIAGNLCVAGGWGKGSECRWLCSVIINS